VLQDSSPGMSANGTAASANRAAAAADYHAGTAADLAACATNCAREARRPIQLRRWFRELASRLVSSEEGVVLQGSRQGLPQPGRRWMRAIYGALRLQCRLRQLDAGLVGRQEGLVLLQQGEGLPSSSWWMCLIFGVRTV